MYDNDTEEEKQPDVSQLIQDEIQKRFLRLGLLSVEIHGHRTKVASIEAEMAQLVSELGGVGSVQKSVLSQKGKAV